MNETIRLPRSIDEPPMMLFWRSDELVPLAILFIVGFVAKQIFICLVLGFLSIKIVRKYRDIKPDGYVIHYLWKKGIFPIKSRTAKNPFETKYVNYNLREHK